MHILTNICIYQAKIDIYPILQKTYGNKNATQWFNRWRIFYMACAELFGFRNGIYSGNSSYVSEGVIDLNGSRYLYLVVDDYNNNVNNSFYSAFNSSILNKNILARITTQSSYFNILSQNNLSLITTPRQYFGPVDIQKLRIQLLDEYGRIVDLHNMDYSFCLTLQSVYDL